jgi:O-methyltransferase
MIIVPPKIRALLRLFGYYIPQFRYNYNAIIKDVQGDIVECGVGYGNSIVVLGSLASIEGKNRKIYGFDSFEGFPEEEANTLNVKQFAGANLGRVRKRIDSAKVPIKINLIKGFFSDTLKKHNGKIAFLHIDVDTYSSYKAVLEALFEKVVTGGVVLFDEYKNPDWPGATRAIDGFIAGRYKIRKSEWINKFYIIK